MYANKKTEIPAPNSAGKAGEMSSQPQNVNLVRLLRLTREMLALADEGDRDRTDPSCGILRDTAYKLRNLADQECQQHKETGKWCSHDE